jgi:type I restriction enzyme S subunit
MDGNFPKNWTWTKIANVCELINGRAFKPNEWSSTGLPIVRIQNLNNINAAFNYCNFEVDEKYLIENGDLLFAWSGTPGTSFGAHIWNRGKAVLNQHIFKVKIDENLLNKFFLMYLLNHKVNEYIRKAHGTAGLAHITKRKFEDSFIPLPPLAEQMRIVEKIEELFTRLEAGVEALKKVKAQIRRYRQAVLKYAFEGKLTEEWRKHAGANYGVGPENIKKGKHIGSPIQDDLSPLPEGWVWVRLGEVCLDPQYGWTTSAASDGTLHLLRTSDITSGNIDWTTVPFCKKEPPDVEKYLLMDGDIVISRAGSIGYSCLIKNPPKAVFASYLIRFKPLINEHYLAYFLKSPLYWEAISEKQLGIAIPNVNATKLKQIPIPLPPLPEQRQIVSEIERRFSVADEVEKVVEQSLKQAERLKQSILKRAFEGKLVPQEPNDEPAERLLERIRLKEDKNIKDNKVTGII